MSGRAESERMLHAAGWRLERANGKHIIWRCGCGDHQVAVSRTPSDHRTLENLRHEIGRCTHRPPTRQQTVAATRLKGAWSVLAAEVVRSRWGDGVTFQAATLRTDPVLNDFIDQHFPGIEPPMRNRKIQSVIQTLQRGGVVEHGRGRGRWRVVTDPASALSNPGPEPQVTRFEYPLPREQAAAAAAVEDPFRVGQKLRVAGRVGKRFVVADRDGRFWALTPVDVTITAVGTR